MALPVTFFRFVLNGLVATAIHYAVLHTLIEVVHVPSAGLANGIAAVFGITASYIGNRMMVFRSKAAHRETLPKFLLLYAVIALMHAGALAVWTDLWGLPYTAGFLMATGGSLVISFLGNRYFIFRQAGDSDSPPP